MAKIIFFLSVAFIMFFPIFVSNKIYKGNFKSGENKPLIEIFNGTYKKFNKKLEISGTFDKAELFKNSYVLYNLFANDLIKKQKYFAIFAKKENNLITANDVKYINSDYLLNAKKVIYYEKKKFLKGWNFNFKSDKSKGKGKYFEIDKNKNLFAKNIVYYIKAAE
jgi:hypothetical protein